MPKLVPNIAVTVIRDGKRVTPPSGPGAKAFPFTKEEVDSVTKQMPTAFRQPVNETTDDTNTPGLEGDKGAANDPKRPARETAAKKSATSKKATGGNGAEDTPVNAEQEPQDEDDDSESVGEDDDI